MGRTLKAIAGLTSAHTPDDIFDSDDWDHQAYLASVESEGATWDSIYNWVKPISIFLQCILRRCSTRAIALPHCITSAFTKFALKLAGLRQQRRTCTLGIVTTR
jgi:hypothetical protein